MDVKTCLKKMQLVGVLNVATVDENGSPQIRCISAVHYDENSFYFFTAKGKNVTKELLADGRVQILVYTKFKEMIRLSANAYPVPEERQKICIDTIFEEQPYLANLYPGDKRYIGICFEIKDASIEYFNLGVNPIFREIYTIGNGTAKFKGYRITEKCIGCGKCLKVCPQNCIDKSEPYVIRQNNCLHCGACFENCPSGAVIRL
ncbi:MAG: 4Fe-4S binding protein [Ruminococcus sp.]|nr:4Fe-4S binding protein [Ruminococcus sp.]MDE5771294.1 4Fe-4S binding protein [Ruminococcus sp.]